jgi:ribosomal protein S18 acetylase RimI-like enzyme
MIRTVHGAERERAAALVAEQWGGAAVARRGELVDIRGLPTVVAFDGEVVAGVVCYAITGDACEVVSLHAETPGRGVGWALMDAVRAEAETARSRRLWLITTNDNTRALRFYQRWGMQLAAVHLGAVTEARRTLKPAIPERGDDGIPIRDELELELLLTPTV